jgi:hypothetical protein
MNKHALQAEALRAIAQNDYMIDGHYLFIGDSLNAAADTIAAIPELITALRAFDWLRADYCHGKNEASRRLLAALDASRKILKRIDA